MEVDNKPSEMTLACINSSDRSLGQKGMFIFLMSMLILKQHFFHSLSNVAPGQSATLNDRGSSA